MSQLGMRWPDVLDVPIRVLRALVSEYSQLQDKAREQRGRPGVPVNGGGTL